MIGDRMCAVRDVAVLGEWFDDAHEVVKLQVGRVGLEPTIGGL